MNNAELKGKYLEIVIRQEGNNNTLEFLPSKKRKAFVLNMIRIAKEFHLKVIWNQKDYEKSI